MAYNNDQNEPKLPLNQFEKRESASFLPRFYRTSSNKKFLQATLDQLMQPGTVKKINGYIGRTSAKSATANDIFLEAADSVRQDYQFEPSAVIQDYLGNVTFFKDYIDHINHVGVFDGNVTNHSRLNRQEFYSWNPHIDWDKFVNHQNYYWLPFGPSSITIYGQQLEIKSTYTVKGVDEVDNVAYLFTPNGLTRNPTLKLYRGQTYTFEIDAPDNPFSIKSIRSTGDIDRYTKGVTGFGVEKGTITFEVPLDAPNVLFYVSENNIDTGGVFHILDILENTAIDIDNELLGKKTYNIPNGTAAGLALSNGMKVKFGGQVTPSKYDTGLWYVEGVGTSIKLVAERDLEIRTSYAVEKAILFDDTPFDQTPFSDVGAYPSSKDYITINRGSADGNPWSRYNRWFHIDVIEQSAAANGQIADLDQTARATRPIIEFEAGLKLFNFGYKKKDNVDVIDSFTKDVFSTIEGSLGYSVDGIDLAHGMRVLFTADTDSFVKNKIFKVNFIDIVHPGRQVLFDAETQVDVETNTITFSTEHGLTSGNQILYLQNGNDALEGLTNQQIYYVKVVSTVELQLYTDSTLETQVDIFNIGFGTHALEIYAGKRRQINLVLEQDADPQENETVLVNYGNVDVLTTDIVGNQGQTYWYNGTNWTLAQVKTKVNQEPLFDIFDSNGNSYGDISVYSGSSFTGTMLFNYKHGTGSNDVYLGFPLTYQNISNIGDIVFEFSISTDKFAYKDGNSLKTKNTDIGFLKLIEDLDRFSYENGWTTANIRNSQPIVRVFKSGGQFPTDAATGDTYTTADNVIYTYDGTIWSATTFPIDVFDNKDDLEDLEVRVYKNGKRIAKNSYVIETGVVRKFVSLTNSVSSDDIITLRCFAKQDKNANGHYEMPLSLQNNPLNNNIEKFTLGEVIDHVDSIIDNINTFSGTYPGNGNLRDLGKIAAYGTRFVQHSGPLNLSLYHLGSKNANVIKALDQARNDYGKFKRSFIIAASESGIDTDPKRHVDFVLEAINKDKPKTSPYYLSDMVAYTAANRLEFTVLDYRTKIYPLTSAFNLTALSNKAIYIYLNGNQLLHGKDYVFGTDVFFEILADLVEGDLIEVYEYVTTDGCYIPSTPTKLGLYPLFEPKIYTDDTYLEPTDVIQGHDGSITVAFGDYRDDLILELEKRIFNNIKVTYNSDIFDIYDYIPGYDRSLEWTREEVEGVMSKYFFQWTANIQQDYTAYNIYDRTNPFTWNYRGNSGPNGTPVPASWRGIYKWMLDTDRPHTHPWECLGFAIEPTWWQDVYGPAPYTSDNTILWSDISDGIIKVPGQPIKRNVKFAKSVLKTHVPVDDQGTLIAPADSGLATGFIRSSGDGYFVFGDQGMVEAAWRRSSYYAFALIETALLLQPNKVLGTCIDRSRVVRNLNDQFIYLDTGVRIRLQDLKLPSIASSTSRVYTAGLINYVIDYITGNNVIRIESYASDLALLDNKMSSKLGGFTNKEKYKILLDSKNPSSSGGIFVPDENYKISLNSSSPIKKVIYSGVMITKFADGFEVRGYNFNSPYFNYFSYQQNERTINVGGISESFVEWAPGQTYITGKVVKYSNQYFRTKYNHVSSSDFDLAAYARLPGLPVTGGRDIIIRKEWDTSSTNVISYGTKLASIQEVADFLQGYGAYLTAQGFVFDDFNNAMATVTNWETAVKEFAFWTTQNWAVGAVISLSPSANKLIFKSNISTVADLNDDFFEYKVLRVDGQKLEPESISVYRSANEFVLQPENTNYGIFGVTLHLVQKEHVLVVDNTTMFNDTIYDREAGYRQERVKVIGYVTSNWNGSFEIPGFIYDEAITKDWQPWTDYNLGDIVKYKEFYYSASKFLVGTLTFNSDDWLLLEERPTAGLLPNWDYKAEQFTDFYDLDTDNLDSGQQKIAQHLIGYQKRQYLENIIQNDVSQYKFYQGMIIEKGTQNVLNKLFDVLSADGQESLTFDEEWAFRVGEYGAVDVFDEVEFILDESKFKIEPQPMELVKVVDNSALDFVYRQSTTDVYVKPANYSPTLWAATTNTNYLRTPGYVRQENVTAVVNSLTDLVSKSIDSFNNGDYIWAGFEGRGWNVYRLTHLKIGIDDVTYASGTVSINIDRPTSIQVGDVIGIANTTKLNGFFVVTDTTTGYIKFKATIQGWAEPFVENDKVIMYQLLTARVDNIDNASKVIPRYIKNNELIWADNRGDSRWAVYKNAPVFAKGQVYNSTPVADLNFGKGVAIDQTGKIAAIADADGVTLYSKGTADNNWISLQRIRNEKSVTANGFGNKMMMSPNGEWLVIASPEANYITPYGRNEQGRYTRLDEITAGSLNFGSVIAVADTAMAIAGKENTYVYNYTETGGWELTTTIPVGYNPDLNIFCDLSITQDGSTLIVSEPNHNSDSGRVLVYKLVEGEYESVQSIELNINDDDERFGESVAVSASGTYLAVSSTKLNVAKLDQGQVRIFLLTSTGYTEYQQVNSPTQEVNEEYGYDVEFMNDDETLVVFSRRGDVEHVVTFDDGTTSFDDENLRVVDKTADIGRIDIFDRYNTKFVYGESLDNINMLSTRYGSEIAAGNNVVLVSAEKEADTYTASGKVYSYARMVGSTSWSEIDTQQAAVDTDKIKKVFIYNKVKNEIVTYLDFIDPSQGKIAGIADQELKFKTYFDPATYSTGTDQVNVDNGMAWLDTQVGSLWWDLTTARFLDTTSGDAFYKSTVWNQLFNTSTVDIYEWVETKYLPGEWDKLADTEKGLTQNISGKSKYGDAVYSVKKRYDNTSKTFKNTYYFWVKNKKTLPNATGRSIPAYDVSQLIADPFGYGYSYVAFTAQNSLSLVNIKKYIDDKDVVLNVQYWTNKNTENNVHTEWRLCSTNETTVIPYAIEEKWIDSLVGKDSRDRVVPDINLPAKQRYGIEFRPRQGMFVNRVEALKQYIERVNTVLSSKLIADDYDLTDLEKADPQPSIVSATWDQQIDTDAELRFVKTALVKPAVLTPIIKNGKIVDVVIADPGYGYGTLRIKDVDVNDDPISWYGPMIKVNGNGTGAKIQSVIDSYGKVIGYEITESGYGYSSSTLLSIRSFTVLVNSDSENFDRWSLYSWDNAAKQWFKTKVQSYNVTNYWTYIDWYATGYNEFTKVDHVVANTYELVTTDISVGNIVKIANVGKGGWLLLVKVNSIETIDYTQNFTVIGRQNGTVKFLDNLYNYNVNTLGYDSSLFDSNNFDESPTTELRIILNTIKDKILVDELKPDYLNLFFASVRYVLHEQIFVDWVMKTSFVKAMHNVGALQQKVTYNSDNLSNFEDYINEVKPYRTKVREFVSNYTSLDNTQTVVTDFDLPPVIDNLFNVTPLQVFINEQGVVETSYSEISQHPWKSWLDNVGFEVVSIEIIDQGSGYVTRPIVEISGVQIEGGTIATAQAYIANGKVNRIQLTASGSKFIKSPVVTIKGGTSPGGTQARAIAIIGNSPVRTNFVQIKFDRTTKNYVLQNLTENESFVGTGSLTQYKLIWSPDITIGKSYVTIDGVEMLRDSYTLTTKSKLSSDGQYTEYYGLLTFDVAPPAGAAITIEYDKDFHYLNAADRIQYFYDPTTGQIGKEFGQLMTGVDYGGVSVLGLGFEISTGSGWDSLPWTDDAWDAVDPTFDDFIVTVGDPVLYQYRLPYVPEDGQEINIYVSRYNETTEKYEIGVRVDDPNIGTILQTNADALMQSFVGNGDIDIVVLPTSLALSTNDRVIFRKDTSDGSFTPSNDEYDTQLNGGLFEGTTLISATGLAPEDIILDGDDFVTPLTSPAPEEVVPGQVLDSVAIKVFHRISGGTPSILFKNYRGDGVETTFAIGQYFRNEKSVIVKVNNTIQENVTDYTIDWQNNNVVFAVAPANNALVNLVSVSFSAENILDLDHFIADGSTTEYVTNANWLPTIGNSVVLVNGQVQQYSLFGTDDTYTDVVGQTWRSRVGIRFEVPPPADALINYFINDDGLTQTASVITSEFVTIESSASTYDLVYPLGESAPYASSTLVKLGQQFLTAPSIEYFTMDNGQLEYELSDHKYITKPVNSDDVTVYADGTLLNPGANYDLIFDYTPDSYQASTFTVYTDGKDYSPGDVLEAVGGTLGPDGSPAKFLVVGISSTPVAGSIIKLEIIDNGSYQVPPVSPVALSYSGAGTLASVDIDFNLVPKNAFITIRVRQSIYEQGKQLTVVVDTDADYTLTANSITFKQTYAEGTEIEVIGFYNHNILGVERTTDVLIPTASLSYGGTEYYKLLGKLGGRFTLRNPLASGNFVWVIKNGELLMYNVDYILEDDLTTVKLRYDVADTDIVQVIAFTNEPVAPSFAYMQFKDILNRVHYKRLNKAKSSVLQWDLTQTATEIEVQDGSVFEEPNPAKNLPGIIEINGERIEYFKKTGNKLSQLRRATLGTGAPEIHAGGTVVQDIGNSETVPYKDENIVTVYASDGIASNQAAIDDAIEYNTTHIDNPVKVPAPVKVVELPYSLTTNDMEIFVAGNRLRKYGYMKYVNTHYPYSPAGDGYILPDFIVPAVINIWKPNSMLVANSYVKYNNEIYLVTSTGTSGTTSPSYTIGEFSNGTAKLVYVINYTYENSVVLNSAPVTGLQITVVKKIGKLWNDMGKRLAFSDNKISNFLKNTETNLPD